MKAALLVFLAVTSAGQASCATAEDVLKSDRPVRVNGIAAVLKAVRAAVAGKALHLVRPEDSRGISLMDLVLGPEGVPTFRRTHLSYEGGVTGGVIGGTGTVASPPIVTHFHVEADVITEFTGRRPQDCSGKPLDGELIVEYTNEGRGWTVRTKTNRGPGFAAGAFDILTGTLASEIGERGFVRGRIARALVAPWTPPRPDARAQPTVVIGDPFPNVRGNPARRAETTQKLWIDVDSLLPLQWETPVDAFAFHYDPTIVITRPDGIVPPACVQ